jgi:hypothetical protein
MTAKVDAAVGLADLPQPASRAPAEAANIVRPKLRLVNRVGAWVSELGLSELHELHPLESQLPQSISFLPVNSLEFNIMILFFSLFVNKKVLKRYLFTLS